MWDVALAAGRPPGHSIVRVVSEDPPKLSVHLVWAVNRRVREQRSVAIRHATLPVRGFGGGTP